MYAHKLTRWFSGPIAKATLGTSLVFGARLMAQAGTLLIVARLLGPVQFGSYAALTALAVMLGSLSTVGTHLLIVQQGALHDDTKGAHSVIVYALPTTLITASLLLLAYGLVSHFFLLAGSALPFNAIMALGTAEICVQPLIQLAASEHQAQGQTTYSQWQIVLPLVLRMGVALTIFVTKPDSTFEVFSSGYLLASLTGLLFAIQNLPRSWPKPGEWRVPTATELRQVSGYAFLNLTAMGPTEIDKTIAAKLLPLGAAGIYAAATRVIGALVIPVTAMILAALPRLFRQYQSHSHSQSPLNTLILCISLGYGLFMALILWGITPFLPMLFGSGFGPMTDILPWLTLAVPGLSLRIAAGGILLAAGRPWLRAGYEVFGIVVISLSAALLTRVSPVSGMPLALTFPEWSMALAGWLMIWAVNRSKGRQIRFSI